MAEKFPMLINGEKVLTDSYIEVKNPASYNDVVGYVPKGSKQNVDAAMDAAQDALKSKWSNWENSTERGKVMYKAIELIRKDLNGLATLYTSEQGKPFNEAKSEIESFLTTMYYFAGYGGKIRGVINRAKLSDTEYLLTEDRPEPIGVISAITPWNFAISLLGWKIAPALICGNSLVIKPSSTTPLTTIELIQRLYDAGLPKGVANVVTGSSSDIGDYIVEHPKVRKVSFTGSTEVGRRVYQKAALGVKYVTLELGGSDPTIVCDDADLDEAAKNIVEKGRFRNCGQSCTSVKRLYVEEGAYDKFIKLLLDYTSKIKVGNGLNPEVTMGPLHNKDQRELIERLVDDAVSYNSNVLIGGKRPDGKDFENGHFYEPTVLTDINESALIWKEECFGPALPVAKVKNLDEAIERANDTEYGLGAGIWTNDMKNVEQFKNKIEAGIKWINSPPLSVPETSFGGIKTSGIGRELGERALFENLETTSSRTRFEI